MIGSRVWVWLNGRYLPRSLEGRWRNHLMIQTVMIVFISFFPGISGWGHLGGAVGVSVALAHRAYDTRSNEVTT